MNDLDTVTERATFAMSYYELFDWTRNGMGTELDYDGTPADYIMQTIALGERIIGDGLRQLHQQDRQELLLRVDYLNRLLVRIGPFEVMHEALYHE